MNREEKMFPIGDPRFPYRVQMPLFFSDEEIFQGLFAQEGINRQKGVEITIGPSDPVSDFEFDREGGFEPEDLEKAVERSAVISAIEAEFLDRPFTPKVVLFFGSIARASSLSDCDWCIEGTGEVETKEGSIRQFQFRIIASPHRGMILPFVGMATDVPLLDIQEES